MIAGRLERHYAWAQDPAQVAEVAGHASTALGCTATTVRVVSDLLGTSGALSREHLWWPRWYHPVAAYTTYDLPLPTVVMAAMLLPSALWVGLTCHRHVVSRHSEG